MSQVDVRVSKTPGLESIQFGHLEISIRQSIRKQNQIQQNEQRTEHFTKGMKSTRLPATLTSQGGKDWDLNSSKPKAQSQINIAPQTLAEIYF